MEKIKDKDFGAFLKRKREEARKIADAEEREKRKSKDYDPRSDQKQIEANTERYNEELTQKVLPCMKGYMGIWSKEEPPPLNAKRNLLYVMAKRQARLQAQIDWLHMEQEKHRQEEHA